MKYLKRFNESTKKDLFNDIKKFFNENKINDFEYDFFEYPEQIMISCGKGHYESFEINETNDLMSNLYDSKFLIEDIIIDDHYYHIDPIEKRIEVSDDHYDNNYEMYIKINRHLEKINTKSLQVKVNEFIESYLISLIDMGFYVEFDQSDDYDFKTQRYLRVRIKLPRKPDYKNETMKWGDIKDYVIPFIEIFTENFKLKTNFYGKDYHPIEIGIIGDRIKLYHVDDNTMDDNKDVHSIEILLDAN